MLWGLWAVHLFIADWTAATPCWRLVETITACTDTAARLVSAARRRVRFLTECVPTSTFDDSVHFRTASVASLLHVGTVLEEVGGRLHIRSTSTGCIRLVRMQTSTEQWNFAFYDSAVCNHLLCATTVCHWMRSSGSWRRSCWDNDIQRTPSGEAVACLIQWCQFLAL